MDSSLKKQTKEILRTEQSLNFPSRMGEQKEESILVVPADDFILHSFFRFPPVSSKDFSLIYKVVSSERAIGESVYKQESGERIMTDEVKQNQKIASSEIEKEWNSSASFKLEFQTQGYGDEFQKRVLIEHLESGEAKTWSRVDDLEIFDWILSQVEELNILSVKGELDDSPPAIKITQVKFLQPSVPVGMAVNPDQAIPSSVLSSNDPVALEVSFKLTGDVSELIQQGFAYQMQGRFHDRRTGIDIPVRSRSSESLAIGQRNYTVCLPEVLLSPGTFRLELVTMLEHSSISPAIFQMPIIQVV
jgi:hypothetical protein